MSSKGLNYIIEMIQDIGYYNICRVSGNTWAIYKSSSNIKAIINTENRSATYRLIACDVGENGIELDDLECLEKVANFIINL